jgi:hypothetical protein
MSKKSLVPVNLLASPSTPTGQHAGDSFFDTDSGTLKIFTGVVWLEFLPKAFIDELLFINGGDASTPSYSDNTDGGLPDSNYTEEYDGGGVWANALYPDGPDLTLYDGGIYSTVYTANFDSGSYNTIYTEIGIDGGPVNF